MSLDYKENKKYDNKSPTLAWHRPDDFCQCHNFVSFGIIRSKAWSCQCRSSLGLAKALVRCRPSAQDCGVVRVLTKLM